MGGPSSHGHGASDPHTDRDSRSTGRSCSQGSHVFGVLNFDPDPCGDILYPTFLQIQYDSDMTLLYDTLAWLLFFMLR